MRANWLWDSFYLHILSSLILLAESLPFAIYNYTFLCLHISVCVFAAAVWAHANVNVSHVLIVIAYAFVLSFCAHDTQTDTFLISNRVNQRIYLSLSTDIDSGGNVCNVLSHDVLMWALSTKRILSFAIIIKNMFQSTANPFRLGQFNGSMNHHRVEKNWFVTGVYDVRVWCGVCTRNAHSMQMDFLKNKFKRLNLNMISVHFQHFVQLASDWSTRYRNIFKFSILISTHWNAMEMPQTDSKSNYHTIHVATQSVWKKGFIEHATCGMPRFIVHVLKCKKKKTRENNLLLDSFPAEYYEWQYAQAHARCSTLCNSISLKFIIHFTFC